MVRLVNYARANTACNQSRPSASWTSPRSRRDAASSAASTSAA